MDILTQQVINGLSVGCIYALIALGYTMVYGVLRMVNFAHGEIFMLGPMFTLFLLNVTGVVSGPFSSPAESLTGVRVVVTMVWSALGGALFAGIVNTLTERTAYRRLRKSASELSVLSSLGISIFLQNAAMFLGGRNKKAFPRLMTTQYITIGEAVLSSAHIVIVGVSLVVLALLFYLVYRTYLGRCVRAVAEDHVTANLMGVNVNRTISSVFLIGGAIGGISGWMYSIYYTQVMYAMGSLVGIKGFTAAVVGGIGNIAGAAIGGLIIGLLETVGGGYLPILTQGVLGTEYKDIFTFLVLVFVLILRPQGLLGEPTDSK